MVIPSPILSESMAFLDKITISVPKPQGNADQSVIARNKVTKQSLNGWIFIRRLPRCSLEELKPNTLILVDHWLTLE